MEYSDCKSTFVQNFKKIKLMQICIKVLIEKYNYDLSSLLNKDITFDKDEYELVEKLEEEKLKQVFSKVIFDIEKINNEITHDIHDQLKNKIQNHNLSFEYLNLEYLKSVSEETYYSKPLLLGICLSLVRNDEDLKCLKEDYFDDIDLVDVIHTVLDSEFICSNKTSFAKKYIEEEIMRNYLSEDFLSMIYIGLTDITERTGRVELVRTLKKIQSFENNLLKSGVDPNVVEDIKMLINLE